MILRLVPYRYILLEMLDILHRLVRSYKILVLLIILGGVGSFFGRSNRPPAELIVQEIHNVNPLRINYEDKEDSFLYIRKFRCFRVNEVNLQFFHVKSGKVTDLWDANYHRISGGEPSSSCLFIMLSEPRFQRPLIEFNFDRFYSESGGGLSIIDSKSASEDGYRETKFSRPSRDRPLPTDKWQPAGISWEPSDNTAFKLGKPSLFYLSGVGDFPVLDVNESPPTITSIREAKVYSRKHSGVEFFIIYLLWLK